MNSSGTVRSAIVAGGGIGGLAAAIALARSGWQVTVLEQAVVFWEAGAGLLVTPNGVRTLGAIGRAEAVRDAGWPVRLAGVRGVDGRWLVELPAGPRALTGVGIHRRALHAALLDGAADVAELYQGARVVSASAGDPEGAPAHVSWQDAEGEHEREVDLLVAADGAQSAVRAALAPQAALDPTGLSSWRGVVADATGVGDDALAWWGAGAEVGVQRIAAERVSWQAIFRHPEGVRFDDDLSEATRRFAGWPEEVRAVVARTRPAEVVRHDLYEVRGLASFVAGRAAFLGDAAHTLLPTLAQGANLALEDAVSLGRLLPPGASLSGGLEAYDARRRPRAEATAARSRRVAALVVGPLGSALRVVPDAVATRWYRGVYDWEPPA